MYRNPRTRTRKQRGGVVGSLKKGAQRFTTSVARQFGRPSIFAPTAPRFMSSMPKTLPLGTLENKLGKSLGKPKVRKPVIIKLATENFPVDSIRKENISRIHPASYKGVWKKLFPAESLPFGLTSEEWQTIMIQKLKRNGRLKENVAESAKPLVEAKDDVDNAILSSLLVVEANPVEAEFFAEEGKKFLEVNPSYRDVKEAIVNHAKNIRESAQNIVNVNTAEPPILTETLNAQRERILLQTYPDIERLKEMQLSEIMYWQPIRTLIFKLGYPTATRLPILSRMTRSITFPAQLMISGRNLSQMRKSSMLPFEPKVSGWETIENDIFTIARYKLTYTPNFNFKSFKRIFDPESLSRLKFGIIKYYLQDKNGGKQLLSDFIDTVNYGLVDEPRIMKEFLKLLERDPTSAHAYLNSILSTDAAQAIKQKYIAREAFLKSKGWFAGRTMWTVLLGSSLFGFLLYLAWFGVKSGIPVMDNISFRLFTIGEAIPSFLTEKGQAIKKMLGFAEKEAAVVGNIIETEVTPRILNVIEQKGDPIFKMAEKVKQKHEEITGPYRNTTLGEYLTGRKYPKAVPFRNRTFKLPKVNEVNESSLGNNV
jgi:hypothetical protein